LRVDDPTPRPMEYLTMEQNKKLSMQRLYRICHIAEGHALHFKRNYFLKFFFIFDVCPFNIIPE